MEIKELKLSKLLENTGQIEGLPKNPRIIKDEKFNKLVKSIKDSPEMLNLRELIVYPYNDKYVVLCGNMRFKALKELNADKVPCKVLDINTSLKKLREYTIKDNVAFGEDNFDFSNLEWDVEELSDWGLDLYGENNIQNVSNFEDKDIGENERISATKKLSELKYNDCYYVPKEKPDLKLIDCIDLELFNKKVKALDEYNLTQDQKEVLKWFCYRFIKIDFEGVANYYAFCATDEEKKSLERLRMVLVDNGVDGFIEDDLIHILQDLEDNNINDDFYGED